MAAPTALIEVASRALLAVQPLMMRRPLTHARRQRSQVVYVEPGANASNRQNLTDRGYQVVVAEQLGKVNAIACPEGLQSNPEGCAAASDPRGFGLAANTE